VIGWVLGTESQLPDHDVIETVRDRFKDNGFRTTTFQRLSEVCVRIRTSPQAISTLARCLVPRLHDALHGAAQPPSAQSVVCHNKDAMKFVAIIASAVFLG
jgi:hypothetical protein